MDTPDENTTAATTRPLFGNKMALAAVENTQTEAETAEVAQDEAMTAEAEETPVETIEVAGDAPLADAAVSTELTEDTTHSAEAVAEFEEDRAATLAPEIAEQSDLVDAVNEEAVHDASDDEEVAVEVDNTTVENLPVEEQTAVTEALDAAVDTTTETVVGEVDADPADLAEAASETEGALAAPVPEAEAAEVEQDAETDTSAEETVKVTPDAPATEDAKTVEELQAERQKLDDEIKSKVDAQKASVIAQIKTVADTYGITADELVEAMGGLKSKRKGVPAKPKYRDPATGTIWSGRGKEPAWIKGQKREDFAI